MEKAAFREVLVRRGRGFFASFFSAVGDEFRALWAAMRTKSFWIHVGAAAAIAGGIGLALWLGMGFDATARLRGFAKACRDLSDARAGFVIISTFVVLGGGVLSMGGLVEGMEARERGRRFPWLGILSIWGGTGIVCGGLIWAMVAWC